MSLIQVPERLWQIMAVTGLAALFSFLAGYPARTLGIRLGILDEPGYRSSHTKAVPRLGGLAILLGAFAAIALFSRLTTAFIVAASIAVVIAVISFLDDMLSLPSLPRLAVHLAAAGVAVWLIKLAPVDIGLPYLKFSMPFWIGLPLAMLFVVGFVNFFNFMDGINGIAASQGIWGGLTISLLLLFGGTARTVLSAAALGGACLGFLPHNFPRAQMFMGDTGSTTVGFALGMLTLIGANHTQFPWLAFILPLGVFIYDATFTLFKRILAGENFIRPHREHHYQLLVRAGWSHARVAVIQMGLMTLCCIGAVIYAGGNDLIRLIVLLSLLAAMAVYSVLVHCYFKKHAHTD